MPQISSVKKAVIEVDAFVTSMTNASPGMYCMICGTPPVGISIGDVFLWNGAAAALHTPFGALPPFLVDSANTPWQKVYSTWVPVNLYVKGVVASQLELSGKFAGFYAITKSFGGLTVGEIGYWNGATLVPYLEYLDAPAVITALSGESYVKYLGSWVVVSGAPAAEFGQVLTIANGQTSATTSFTDIAGSAFTLPSSGVWHVNYDVYVTAASAALVILTDMDNNIVGRSESEVNGSGVAAQSGIEITTSGVAQFKLRFCSRTAGSTAVVRNDATASSRVSWSKISGFVASKSVQTFTDKTLITATGGIHPVKGPSSVDYISLVDDGSGWCSVTQVLNMTGAGTAGSGTYEYSLPALWIGEIDPVFHPFNTQLASLNGAGEVHKVFPGSSGLISNAGGSSQQAHAIPSGPRKFKIMGGFGISSGLSYWFYQSSVYFQLSGAMHQQVSFRFKKK